jgi:hypothetical protein
MITSGSFMPSLELVRYSMSSREAPDRKSGLPLTSNAQLLFPVKNDPEVIMALSLRLTSAPGRCRCP